jgi:hypothetical protein
MRGCDDDRGHGVSLSNLRSWQNVGVGLWLQPARVKRYGEIARLLSFFLTAAGDVWLAFNILHCDRPGKSPR